MGLNRKTKIGSLEHSAIFFRWFRTIWYSTGRNRLPHLVFTFGHTFEAPRAEVCSAFYTKNIFLISCLCNATTDSTFLALPTWRTRDFTIICRLLPWWTQNLFIHHDEMNSSLLNTRSRIKNVCVASTKYAEVSLTDHFWPTARGWQYQMKKSHFSAARPLNLGWSDAVLLSDHNSIGFMVKSKRGEPRNGFNHPSLKHVADLTCFVLLLTNLLSEWDRIILSQIARLEEKQIILRRKYV